MTNSQALAIKPKTQSVPTGISDQNRKAMAEKLGVVLSNTYMLYVKTQGVHWNIVGPSFYGVHKLTEEQYEDLAATIDSLAERIRALGHIAPASVSVFSELSLVADQREAEDGQAMIDQLVADNEAVAALLREFVAFAEEIEDVYTADLLTSRIGVHEEAAWMLRSLAA
ncbi:MAG: Dps family protein [Alphaproteobacteria bacterium]